MTRRRARSPRRGSAVPRAGGASECEACRSNAVPAFRPLPDHELERLDDEALIAYIIVARDHGDLQAAGRGLAIMVFGYWSNVRRRVRLKVPETHVDDVTAGIIERAIQSAFDGESVGRFVKWLQRITQRAIADF